MLQEIFVCSGLSSGQEILLKNSSSSVLIPNIDCVQIKFDTLSITLTVTVLYMCV